MTGYIEMAVTAVVVNYKTERLVGQLIRHLYAFPEIRSIIVVDNSGAIDLAEKRAGPKNIELIRNSANLGFAKGVNQGLKHVETDWVLVINPDVRLDNACLRHLLDAANTYDAVLTGPRFYWDDDYLFRLPPSTGDFMGMYGALNAASHFEIDAKLADFYWQIRHERFWAATEPFFEPFLSGACLLVQMPWILAKGGVLFDERFFLYYEDTDLCAQALLNDESPICVPAAKAIHYYNQSPAPPQTKMAAINKSGEQFYEKYYSHYRVQTIHGPPSRPLQIEDLGKQKTPPRFGFGKDCDCGYAYFEIALNSLFVPFIQCDLASDDFCLPETVWQRLAPGTYYSRVRNPQKNQNRIWKWEKVNA
ncbi:MAG: glycosyltransferase family 2 protein [Desulfobacterales bacterium]|nr:glycosyltransferase family 2 protein [Desulfobacterales bacterium]